MCRFISYIGQKKQLISEFLQKPQNSLIRQSVKAKVGPYYLNADGFGMAWYDLEIDNNPAIFKTTQPAWNDSNLNSLCQKISSNCFLAHVRASTVGDVTKTNCHPFFYQNYSFVHNGTIENFHKIRLKLFNFIDEDLFHEIKGTTDSESFFFLVVHFLRRDPKSSLPDALKSAFSWVADVMNIGGDDDYARLNVVLSNGKELVATRYAIKDNKHLSLYYTTNKDGLLIASEPLDENLNKWTEVPANHYIFANLSNEFVVEKI